MFLFQLFQCRLPNTLGRGESVTADYNLGTKNTSGTSVTFNKFIAADPNLV